MSGKHKAKRLLVYSVIGLILFFVLFLQPETVFEEQYNGTGHPFSVEVKTYGTGFFNRQLAVIHYKIDGKTVERENFTFYDRFSDDFDLVWSVEPDKGTWWIDNSVHISMSYWKSQGLHDGELKTKTTGYDFDDAGE